MQVCVQDERGRRRLRLKRFVDPKITVPSSKIGVAVEPELRACCISTIHTLLACL